MLYLESPIYVGFSYNSTKQEVLNDTNTIEAKYAALLNFYEKFPHLKKSKFYISGESYGGVYVPLLTRKILENQNQHNINLQGNCAL